TETYPSITSSNTAEVFLFNGSPSPPPPEEGRVKLSLSLTRTLEKKAPNNSSFSFSGFSQLPCGIEGRPLIIPQVTERERSQHTDITESLILVSVSLFRTLQPPLYSPGPPESIIISWLVVTTGVKRSCPSQG